jgi:hypothetical protein
MFKEDVYKVERLPEPEERRRILENARAVLAEARSMVDQLDQGLVPVSVICANRFGAQPLSHRVQPRLAAA